MTTGEKPPMWKGPSVVPSSDGLQLDGDPGSTSSVVQTLAPKCALVHVAVPCNRPWTVLSIRSQQVRQQWVSLVSCRQGHYGQSGWHRAVTTPSLIGRFSPAYLGASPFLPAMTPIVVEVWKRPGKPGCCGHCLEKTWQG